MAEPEGFAATFVALYRQIHDQLRKEIISDLDSRALTWVPGPETNSISTLVVHLLGSEAEVLRVVRGLPSDRDRTAEFSMRIEDPQELLSRIDSADRLLEQLGPLTTEEDLATPRVRPGAVRNTAPRTGLFWLLNSYGHAREHLGHLQLTNQLLGQRNPLRSPEGVQPAIQAAAQEHVRGRLVTRLVDVAPGDPRLGRDVLPVLAELRPHLTPEALAEIYSEGYPEGLRFTAAYDEQDHCVGVAGWRIVATTVAIRKLYVDDLVTSEAHRSHGVGSALLQELTRRAEAAGCRVVDLDCGVERNDAHRFYFRERMRITAYHFARTVI